MGHCWKFQKKVISNRAGDTRVKIVKTVMRSPKAKFSVRINFDEAIKEIGSQVTFTADTVEQIKAYARHQAGQHAASVIISENRKRFPEFDWVEIERYNLNK